MASEWSLASKGCPAELRTAVTMENLPSPPQQLPACLHARPGSSFPSACLPRSQTVSLSRTRRALQTWPPGMDSWCQAGQTDQLLIWCGQGEGAGEEGSSGAQAAGAGRGPGAPHCRDRNTDQRGRALPQPHSTEETNTPHLSLCPGAADSLV